MGQSVIVWDLETVPDLRGFITNGCQLIHANLLKDRHPQAIVA
jgi:hypothetical protein